MDLLEIFRKKVKQNPQRVVLPEGMDERIQAAAAIAAAENIARPILIGDPERIRASAADRDIDLDGVAILNPRDSDRLDHYGSLFSERRPEMELTDRTIRRFLKKDLAFGGMMVAADDADAMVAGADNTTVRVIQTTAATIGFLPGITIASSFLTVVIPEFLGEKDKVFVFSDPAMAVQPSAEELAQIAVSTGWSTRTLFGIEPKIAMLSFSTKGSASHDDVDKVTRALELARQMDPSLVIDGELQLDSAIVPSVAEMKVSDSPVAGRADVLIFPDLDAANIGYKFVKYAAQAEVYGPIMQGFTRPCSDLSRGTSVGDVLGTIIIISVYAQNSAREGG